MYCSGDIGAILGWLTTTTNKFVSSYSLVSLGIIFIASGMIFAAHAFAAAKNSSSRPRQHAVFQQAVAGCEMPLY